MAEFEPNSNTVNQEAREMLIKILPDSTRIDVMEAYVLKINAMVCEAWAKTKEIQKL